MLIQTKKVTTEYTRTSKFNKSHTYTRTKTIVVIQCDSCQSLFERDQGKMDRQRVSSDYYHVCSNCNPKKFAQRRGVERRQMWKLSADSDIDISKI
jgi:uncharacterized protein with NRDE domain